MSIVIKADEVNFIIYKYLLEAGLQHTAYSIFNEAQIEKLPKEYQQDVKPGHLIHLIERGLIFNQIEGHIHLSEYCECKQEMNVIKPHECDIIKKEKLRKKKEDNHTDTYLHEAINRTENLINNNIANEDQNIFNLEYNYFKQSTRTIKMDQELDLQNIKFSFNQDKSYLTYYDDKKNCILNIQYSSNLQDELQTQSIIPCCVGEEFQKIKVQEWDPASNNYLLVIYESGLSFIYSDQDQKISKIFKLNNMNKMLALEWNPTYPNLCAFVYNDTIEVVDPLTRQNLLSFQNVYQIFKWRYYDQFITLNHQGLIQLRAFEDESVNLQIQTYPDTNKIEFNKSKNLLASFSPLNNSIRIFTLQSDQHVLEIKDDDPIQDFKWCFGNVDGVGNYMAVIFKKKIKLYDIEFGAQKYVDYFKDEVKNCQIIDGLYGSLVVIFTENELNIIDVSKQYKFIMSLQNMVPGNIQKISDEDIICTLKEDIMFINLRHIELL